MASKTACIMLLGLVVAACSAPPRPKVQPITVARGQGLELGSFFCQVDTATCVYMVGDRYVHSYPRGIFWLVKLTTENRGKDVSLFNVSYFRLLVDTTFYAPDFRAAAYMGDASFHERIPLAPGQSRGGYLIFDVPENATDARLVFQNIYFTLPKRK